MPTIVIPTPNPWNNDGADITVKSASGFSSGFSNGFGPLVAPIPPPGTPNPWNNYQHNNLWKQTIGS